MGDIETKKAKKLIRDLLFVLVLGALSAGGLALAALYFLGPAGDYKAGNILVSPETAFHLSYKEINQETGKSVAHVFDRVELRWLDPKLGKERQVTLDEFEYGKIYNLVYSDRSINPVPDSIERLFHTENPAIMTINVKETGSLLRTLSPFQEMQVLSVGDYYRIQLRQESRKKEWAYFFHENIYGEIYESR